MKQKIVINVQMNCEKCRTKAMKIATVAEGVTSVAIEGADKSQVVVIGDGVDSASLTRSLRKKLGYATIESVQKLEESTQSSAEKIPEEKEDNPTPILWSSSYGQYPQVPLYYAVISDPYPSNCVTM
ncbi:heavy metal-associated isoprenylated plant protein 47-like [Castanea sativa]|uniref:heavy metal-associated isoprenylated plant protein 47-like n=1 Tax=Castanea sativa TaxID=21020 RepID=UPI003F650899